MKKYVNILIGIVVLLGVLYGGQLLISEREEADITDIKAEVGVKSFSGEVVRVFEGENKLSYSFDIPETASTSIDMDGALIRITNETNPLASVYLSYEGARGYTPMDYINNTIAPHVAVINPTSTSTIGGYDWQGAESEGSEWHVASVLNGSWLIVVENRKSVHDATESILTSVKAY